MFVRNSDGEAVTAGGAGLLNASPAGGQLLFGGGTAFTSASNPSAEVLDGTGVNAGASPLGVSLDATAGTITINRSGFYLVSLALHDFSCGAASGNVQFDVQVNSADISGTGMRLQVIRAASTAKAGVTMEKVVSLKKGDVVRTIVTSAAGTVITVTEGTLRVTQIRERVLPTVISE